MSTARLSPLARGFGVRGAQLLAFSSIAVAQPLFDLLGRHPTFFTTGDGGNARLIWFALAIALGPSIALMGLEALAYLLGGRRGLDVVHLVFLGVLSTLLFAPVVKRWGLPDVVTVVIALAFGAILVLAGTRLRGFTRLTTWSASATFVVLAVFLFATPTSTVLRTKTIAPIGSGLSFRHTPPIVIFRTDELPLPSLIHADGTVDAIRYPHFAEFAKTSTWYRNATTVSDGTRYAVPSMLTGLDPKLWSAQLPTHHPRSIFAALGGVYDFRGGTEGICPSTICPLAEHERKRVSSVRARDVAHVIRDGFLLYGHLVAPPSVTRRLPPPETLGIDTLWKSRGIDAGRPTAPDPRWLSLDAQIGEIHRGRRPTFDVVTVPMPHQPWSLLPGGQAHSDTHWNVPGLELRVPWTRSPQPVLSAYQAHLAQLGGVDTLLGRLISRLRAEGLYDDALVVVISDHGQSFTPGQPHRGTTLLNESVLAEIAAVPFFIKFPGQREGRIDDRAAEVKDLFPTIMDALGADPGWPMDARSLTGERRSVKRVLMTSRGQEIEIPADIASRARKAAERKFVFTGLRPKPETELQTFYAVGKHRELIGRSVQSFPHRERSEIDLTISDAIAYRDVDLKSLVVPSAVTAFTTKGSTDRGTVAVGVNGRIAAVADLVRWEGRTRLDALFWPGFLKDGMNHIDLFELDGGALHSIPAVES